MEEGKYILLLGSPNDTVLLQTQDGLTRNGVRAYVVPNVSLVNISVPLGVDNVEAKIIIDSKPLPLRSAKAFLVSHVTAASKDVLDSSDTQYAEHEAYASWLALLSMVPCRVINRPSTRIPVMHYNSMQIRSFARALGVPTVKEEICSKRELTRRKQRGENLACIDLSNQQPFCLADGYPIEGGRLYSILDVPCDTTYAITVRIVDEFLTFSYAPSQGMFPTTDVLQQQLKDSSRTLLDALSLTYAYCIYAFQSYQQEIPEFIRLYTSNPSFLPQSLSNMVTDKIVEELKR